MSLIAAIVLAAQVLLSLVLGISANSPIGQTVFAYAEAADSFLFIGTAIWLTLRFNKRHQTPTPPMPFGNATSITSAQEEEYATVVKKHVTIRNVYYTAVFIGLVISGYFLIDMINRQIKFGSQLNPILSVIGTIIIVVISIVFFWTRD